MDKHLEEINEQLEHATEVKRKAERLEAKLEKQLQDRRRLHPKVKKLREVLEAEIEDVEKLRKLSFKSMLATVLRLKEKWEQKEWQEYLEADLNHTRYREALDEAEREAAAIEGQLAALGDWRKVHAELLSRKEEVIQSSGEPSAMLLIESKQKLAETEADIKELQQAIRAGNSAGAALKKVEVKLKSAKNFGTWDMLGGGMLVSLMKHDSMDGARTSALQAQRALDRFQSELGDVGTTLNRSIQLDKTTKIFDLFFDNIFVDWMVQSKLQRASKQCMATKKEVRRIVQQCQGQLDEAMQKREQLAADYDRILQSA